ncbi:MAG: hypothetical protein Q7S17_07720 [Xanthobacteraceae bacterium]|nr:hypothetical protein [Xanthobacteraceae bacterium]
MNAPAVAATDEQPRPRDDTRLTDALKGIIGRLEVDASKRVGSRSEVEQRWLDDLRQLRGKYDDKTFTDLKDAKKSTLFINKTLPKVNACEARLSDMLFPTDDKNWGIQPTPVPELTQAARDAAGRAEKLVADANEAMSAKNPEQAKAIATEAQGFAEMAQKLRGQMDEAKKRSDAMQSEIEDQLVECNYASECRDVIQDACKVGTGIMKGPIGSNDRVRRAWKPTQQQDGSTLHQLEMASDPRPANQRVDYWAFFPESDCRSMRDCGSTFERHMWSEKELRALGRQPGFDKDAIRRLLRGGPTGALPTYLQQIRAITGENFTGSDKRFVGWEYRGPLTAQEMRDLCDCMGEADQARKYEEVDPLDEIDAVIWFCNGELLKWGIGHLDSAESIYSVYNLEKDDSSPWGFGIPYMMRDSQRAMSGAWRMMMDNAGLSCRPQIEIDRSVIDPADNQYELVSGKIWLRKAEAPIGKVGITTHNIESHQGELEGIIALCNQFIDDETSITVLAQGEQGSHTTQTAQGMALLMNAVNVVFRRFVKNFDDDLTTPVIRRLYDWNMQFSKKEHIKGDFKVDARGTSVLLVQQIQSQNLMVLANLTSHPVLGILLEAAPILRKLAQSMMIKADEVVKTDEKIKQMVDQMAQQQEPEDPRFTTMLKIQNSKDNTALQLGQMERDTAMMSLAEHRNMKIEDIQASLARERIRADSSERKLATEVAVEARMGAAGGSGGFISNPNKGKGKGKAKGNGKAANGSGGAIP